MKQVLFLLAIMVAFAVNAQLVTRTITIGNTWDWHPTAYTLTNTTAAHTLYKAPQHYPTTQDYIVKLDSVSGDATSVTVALEGRKFEASAWTSIATVVWTRVPAVSKDTIIVISNATANRYRDFRVLYTPAGTGVTRISNQGLKLYLE